MNPSSVNIAVIDGKTITKTVELHAEKGGSPVRVKALKDGHYLLAEGERGIAPENVTIKRVGKDLHLSLEGYDPDQPQLIIEDFHGSDGQLVGMADDGEYHNYVSSDAEQDHEAALLLDGNASAQVLSVSPLVGFANGLAVAEGLSLPAMLGLAATALGIAYVLTRKSDKRKPGVAVDPDPNQPVLQDVHDNVGEIQGVIESGGVTDDTTPTFKGTGEPGNTVVITDNGVIIGEAPVDANGNWEFTPGTPLVEGAHSVVVVEKDPGGKTSEPTPPFEFEVDITAPDPSDGVLIDDVGAITGPVASGDTTDDSTPTFTGTAEPGARVDIYDGGVLIGSAPVDAAGNWTFTPSAPLADGDHSFSTVVVDPAGNRSPASTPIDFVVDTSAVFISISHVVDDAGPNTGNLTSDSLTDDTTPTLHGRGTAGGTVTIYVDGVAYGTAPVNATGDWEYTVTPALVGGDYVFTATVTTAATGESSPTADFILHIDTTPPAIPAIDSINDDVGEYQGPLRDGASTDDATPTLNGSGMEPGDKVYVYDDGVLIGTEIVGADGTWSHTPNPPLGDGEHVFTTIAEDEAGNRSDPSAPWTIIVDTVAPDAPVIVSVVDDQGDRTGNLTAGEITDDAQPTINGTAEPGSIVIIYDNGVEIGRADVLADGSWTFEPSLPLINGAHELTAKAMDKASNISEGSAPFDFDVLAGGAPPAPAITGVLDDVGSITGNVGPGDVTDDVRPTIQGTGQAGSVVSIYDGTTLLGTVDVGADGRWEFIPTTDLAEGPHVITANATNGVGNISPTTGPYPITVDTIAPDAADGLALTDDVGPITGEINGGDTTDDSTPSFTGTAEPGTRVDIYDNGVLIGSAPVDADGNWVFIPPTPLADGDHSFSTVVEDRAGNRSPQSTPVDFTVDTSAVAISITHVADDVGPNTGSLASDSLTDDTTPTLHGRGTAGGTVTIYVDGVAYGTAPVNAAGDWEYTVTPALVEGDYVFTATVTTAAAGESAPTADFNLSIDTTPPAIPAIDSINDDVGEYQGPLEDGDSTDDTTPTLSGSGLEFGDKVELYDNGTLLARIDVERDGTWSYTPSPPLNDGEHVLTIVAEDEAGNRSAPSAPWTIIVDTVAPEASAVVTSMTKDSGSNSTDFVTNDGTAGRLIQGTLTAALAAGEKVQVSIDGGVTWLDALLTGTNGWSFVDQNSYSNSWEIQTRVIDLAGNSNAVSQTVTLQSGMNAPTSVDWESDVISVEFDRLEVSAGDKLQLVIDGEVHEFELSQADVDSGVKAIGWSSAENGQPQDISAALVDKTGNGSYYKNVSLGVSSVYVESFEGQAPVRFAVGDVYNLEYFDLTILALGSVGSGYTSGFGRENQGGIGNPPPSMALEMGTMSGVASYLLELTGDVPVNNISFIVGDLNLSEVLTAVFFDAAGVEIYRATRTSSDGLLTSISIDVPFGVEFSSVSLTANGYLWIDDISFGSQGYIEGGDTERQVSQLVVDQVSYVGSDMNDVFSIADTSILEGDNSRVDGGVGVDALVLTGAAQELDLIALRDKVSSIEVIDISGSGDNTLKISLNDVLNNGESDLFHESGKVQMMVKGDAGDVVDLQGLLGGEDPGSWASQGQVTVAGVSYDVYQHSALDAELLVQQGVTTNLA